MRSRATWCSAVIATAAWAVTWSAVGAPRDGALAMVVARVGSAAITVADVERKLASVPSFQLATFGATTREAVRAFVEQVMVTDARLAERAKAQHLDAAPGVRERIAQALRTARAEEIRRQVTVSPNEVETHFQENRSRFESPERIGVYRILCASREDAEAVLAEARKASTLVRWNELAREKSIDKATMYRGGQLGFLAQDGSSNEVSVRVDPALFVAAQRVHDGEIVPEVVLEGSAFAVVWRRGSSPAIARTAADEAPVIRQVLERKKAEHALAALIAELRRTRGVETHPELVEAVEVSGYGEVAGKPAASGSARPSSSAVQPRAPWVAPSASPGGLR